MTTLDERPDALASETDHGTPAVVGGAPATVSIDGREVTVPPVPR